MLILRDKHILLEEESPLTEKNILFLSTNDIHTMMEKSALHLPDFYLISNSPVKLLSGI